MTREELGESALTYTPNQIVAIDLVQSLVRRGQEDLDEFQKGFYKDPCFALQWVGRTFEAAARVREGKRILKALEDGMSFQNVVDNLKASVLHFAQNVTSYSTEIGVNEMKRATHAAQARLLDCLDP